ncbi:hypothetical protein ACN4EE_19875 [Geminocystis sp. CENA526]
MVGRQWLSASRYCYNKAMAILSLNGEKPHTLFSSKKNN